VRFSRATLVPAQIDRRWQILIAAIGVVLLLETWRTSACNCTAVYSGGRTCHGTGIPVLVVALSLGSSPGVTDIDGASGTSHPRLACSAALVCAVSPTTSQLEGPGSLFSSPSPPRPGRIYGAELAPLKGKIGTPTVPHWQSSSSLLLRLSRGNSRDRPGYLKRGWGRELRKVQDLLKKLMLVAMALGALMALAVPAVANAAGKLTVEGVSLAKGAPLFATSGNFSTTNPLGTYGCERVSLGGTVTENGTEGATSVATSQLSSSVGCRKQAASAPFTITNISGTIKFQKTNSYINFTSLWSKFPFGGYEECTVTGTHLPVTYSSGSSSTYIAGVTISKGAGCISPAVAGDFFLTTSGGKEVVVH
jgi:hypothetical protein